MQLLVGFFLYRIHAIAIDLVQFLSFNQCSTFNIELIDQSGRVPGVGIPRNPTQTSFFGRSILLNIDIWLNRPLLILDWDTPALNPVLDWAPQPPLKICLI